VVGQSEKRLIATAQLPLITLSVLKGLSSRLKADEVLCRYLACSYQLKGFFDGSELDPSLAQETRLSVFSLAVSVFTRQFQGRAPTCTYTEQSTYIAVAV
jgi:hypothetical protein